MNQQYCMHCMQPMQDGETACKACGYIPTASSPAHHLKSGTILKEKYLIGNALGDGGFGITYIGRDLTLDMRIAVKEYYPNGCANRSNIISNEVTMTHGSHGIDYEKDMNRFLSEARVLARFCNEPGVVGVRDFFRENGTAYIVMEFLDGMTLKNYIATYGPIPAETFFRMIDPMLQVLGDIHKQGLIHRDISPDNIMMLKNGRLKLLDFGAAREVTGDKSLSVVLKPGYAPEEQYRSKGQQGPWTDVYAMCATIYKCITGITPDEAMQRVFEDELKPPSELGVAVTTEQEMVIMQGLCVKSSDRIQSMDDLRNALIAHESEDIRSIQIHRTDEDIFPIVSGLGEKTGYQVEDDHTVFDPIVVSGGVKAESDLTIKQEQDPAAGVSTLYMPPDSTVKIPAGEQNAPVDDPDVTVAVSHETDATKPKAFEETDIKQILNKDSDTPPNVPAVLGSRDVATTNHGQISNDSDPNTKAKHNRQWLEFQYDEQVREQKKKNILRIGLGVLAAIALIILLLLFRSCDQARENDSTGASTSPSESQTQATTNTTKPIEQLEWSEWLDQLPGNVSAEDYDIEERTLYSSRNLETTSSTETNSMEGWELFDTVEAGGGFCAWSDWSSTAVNASETREVDTQTRYRYRTKDTTTGSSSSKSGWTLYDTTYSWGSYSSWSDWSTTSASNSDSRKVETKTQYRYRNISYSTEYTSWGSWSSWQDAAVSETDLRKVETRTLYEYYYYACPGCGSHLYGWAFNCFDCGTYIPDYAFNQVWGTTPQSQMGFTPFPRNTNYSYAYYDGQIVFRNRNGDNSKTQYRYATRSTQQVANYGSWSGWGDTAYSNSSTREVDTRTVYRYADRSQIATYHFYKWGNWSNWSTNAVSSTNDRQVEDATFYRYRNQVKTTTYYFRKWTDWTDFSDGVVTPSDTVEVQQKTQYRYKSKS